MLLEIPIDVLLLRCTDKEVFFSNLSEIKCLTKSQLSPTEQNLFVNKLQRSNKPILVIGNQFYYMYKKDIFQKLLHLLQIPIFTVGLARGLVPDTHELCFGNGRILDSGPQIYAYKHADLIINLGVDFDYQMDYTEKSTYNEEAFFIEITDSYTPLSNSFKLKKMIIEGDFNSLLENIFNLAPNIDLQVDKIQNWKNELTNIQKSFYDEMKGERQEKSLIEPLKIFNKLNSMNKEIIYVLDGSNAMFWANSVVKCIHEGSLFIAPDSTLGPMGTGIPIALGVKLSNPNKTVVLYTGDGSFGFNAMEIDTAIRHNIPIIIIVHNDSCWGFCESTQDLLYKKNAFVELKNTNYASIVSGMGGVGYIVKTLEEFEIAYRSTLELDHKVVCIDVQFDSALLSPGTIAFNNSIKSME